MDRIEIFTSKKKSVLVLIGSIVFVGLGIWFFLNADSFTGGRIRDPFLIRGIGIASVLFFGLGIYAGIKRLIRSELALIIDPIGLNVNPEKSPTEFIKWNEILGFDEINIKGTRILIIMVKDPEVWIEKEKNALKRQVMQFNLNNYNSPFNIAAAGLKITSNKLKEILNSYLENYGSGIQHAV